MPLKNILVVTQKIDINDENLGFFHQWVEEIARNVESVTVIASFVGIHSLPSNVIVLSLGKEDGAGRLKRRWKYWELFSGQYYRADAIFFHMIPEFVIAALPFLVSLKKRTSLWYAHGKITRKLKWAERQVDFVFTSSLEGFRLPSKKVITVGQAIDVDFFSPLQPHIIHPSDSLKLLSVGRIAPVKDYGTLINACAFLKYGWDQKWSLSIVGGPLLPRDQEYMENLRKQVKEKKLEDVIFFEGSRPYSEIPKLLKNHDVLINLSQTGSLDKTVLEAMSCGISVLTSNEAYQSILPKEYFLEHKGAEYISEKIKLLAHDKRPNMTLRNIVLEHHSLDTTIKKILHVLSESL